MANQWWVLGLMIPKGCRPFLRPLRCCLANPVWQCQGTVDSYLFLMTALSRVSSHTVSWVTCTVYRNTYNKRANVVKNYHTPQNTWARAKSDRIRTMRYSVTTHLKSCYLLPIVTVTLGWLMGSWWAIWVLLNRSHSITTFWPPLRQSGHLSNARSMLGGPTYRGGGGRARVLFV